MKIKPKKITVHELADDYKENEDEKSINDAKGIQPLQKKYQIDFFDTQGVEHHIRTLFLKMFNPFWNLKK